MSRVFFGSFCLSLSRSVSVFESGDVAAMLGAAGFSGFFHMFPGFIFDHVKKELCCKYSRLCRGVFINSINSIVV